MSNSMRDLMNTVSRQTGKPYDIEPANGPSEPVRPEMARKMGDDYFGGVVTGTCGETIEVYLKIEREVVTDAAFYTDGCSFSVLCGYLASRLAIGKTVDDAAEIGGDTILAMVDGIPPTETHCAHLAVSALHAAIHEWIVNDRGIPKKSE